MWRRVILTVLIGLSIWWPVAAHTEAGEGLTWHQAWHTAVAMWQSWWLSDVPPTDSVVVWDDDAALRRYVGAYGLAATVRHLDALSATRGTCHQVAHRAGRYAFELVGTDAFRVHTSQCDSGGMHGAAEAFFREHGTRDLDSLLNVVCWQYDLRSAVGECLHGVGHGLMAWADYELLVALQYCDHIPEAAWASACYSGVFMENVLGSLSREEGHRSTYLSETDLHYPCSAVAEKYQTTCYYHQPSRALQVIGRQWPTIVALCAAAPPPARDECYRGVGKELPWQFSYQAAPIAAVCHLIAGADQQRVCLEEALKAVLADDVARADQARAVCEALAGGERIQCEQFVSDWTVYLRSPASSPTPVQRTEPASRANSALTGPAEILITPDAAEPAILIVSRGQTATFLNKGSRAIWPASNIHPTHRIYPDTDIELCGTRAGRRMFDACGEIGPGAAYSFVFREIGTWRWHDHLNPTIGGVIVVE